MEYSCICKFWELVGKIYNVITFVVFEEEQIEVVVDCVNVSECSLFSHKFSLLMFSVWLSSRMLSNECYSKSSSITGRRKNNHAVLWLCFYFVRHTYCSSWTFSWYLFSVWLSFIMLFEQNFCPLHCCLIGFLFAEHSLVFLEVIISSVSNSYKLNNAYSCMWCWIFIYHTIRIAMLFCDFVLCLYLLNMDWKCVNLLEILIIINVDYISRISNSPSNFSSWKDKMMAEKNLLSSLLLYWLHHGRIKWCHLITFSLILLCQ